MYIFGDLLFYSDALVFRFILFFFFMFQTEVRPVGGFVHTKMAVTKFQSKRGGTKGSVMAFEVPLETFDSELALEKY